VGESEVESQGGKSVVLAVQSRVPAARRRVARHVLTVAGGATCACVRASWQALARRDTSELSSAKTHVPLGLQTLDPVAQTVSLAEDDRLIAKARQEVLAAQKRMKHMDLFKPVEAPAKVLCVSSALLPPAALARRSTQYSLASPCPPAPPLIASAAPAVRGPPRRRVGAAEMLCCVQPWPRVLRGLTSRADAAGGPQSQGPRAQSGSPTAQGRRVALRRGVLKGGGAGRAAWARDYARKWGAGQGGGQTGYWQADDACNAGEQQAAPHTGQGSRAAQDLCSDAHGKPAQGRG